MEAGKLSRREIDPRLKYVEVFIDELHWMKLTEVAAEQRVSVDLLIGTIFETVLINLKKIKVGDVGDGMTKVQGTCEPLRKDPVFFDALVTDKETQVFDREVASMLITPEDEDEFNWGDV
jgi:hypothetical protein